MNKQNNETKDDELMPVDDEFQDIEYGKLADDLMHLTPKAKAVLVRLVDAGLSGEKIRQGDIAKELGIPQSTISIMKRNPHFANVYISLVQNNVKTRVAEVLSHLIRNSEQGDTAASKVILQFTESLTNVTKNINLNIDSHKPTNVEESIDAMIIRMGELGISPDAFADRYIELKNAGRF